MSENAAYLVISGIINKENMEELQSYMGKITPVMAAGGGTSVGRFKTVEQLAGEDGPDMVGFIKFESVEAIKHLINSEAFTSLAESRARVFTKLNQSICVEL